MIRRLIQAAAAAILSASAVAPANAESVVARVAGDTITDSAIINLAMNRRWYGGDPETDRARIETLIEDAIADYLISAEARTRKINDDFQAVSNLKNALSALGQELFKNEYVAPRLQLDSATLDTFYQNHIARYTTTRDQRRVRHITVAKPGRGLPENYSKYRDPVYDGWDPRRKIDSIYVRLANGEDFHELAYVHSEDLHSRGSKGDIGWVSEHSLGEGAFADSCLAMTLYHISRPVEGANAWHIIQVTAERPAGPVTVDLEIARDMGRILMEQQAPAIQDTIADSIFAAGELQIQESSLRIPDDQLRPEIPLAVVNGTDTVFAVSYLREKIQLERVNGGPLDVEGKRRIIRERYFPPACWTKLYRDWGYLDRPAVREKIRDQAHRELAGTVKVEVNVPGPPPDSNTIVAYYQTHQDEFETRRQTLRQAWNTIRQRLMDESYERARRQRLLVLEARHGVTRYPENIAQLRLPERP